MPARVHVSDILMGDTPTEIADRKDAALAALIPGTDHAAGTPVISVVVPVYNEQGNIRPFLARTVPVLERLGSYEIIFALHPSRDATERGIRE